MSSAFKNFFITFVICLLVFGFLAFKFGRPAIADALNFEGVIDSKNDSEADVSDTSDTSKVPDTSSAVSSNDDDYDPEGDIFTAVIAAVDDEGHALGCVFIDSTAKTRRYIKCSVPVSETVSNEIGEPIPLSDLFVIASNESVCKAFQSITGLKTDYCVRVDKNALVALVSLMPSAYYDVTENISLMNPAYEGVTFPEGETYPDDYYVNVALSGERVKLGEKLFGKTKLEWIIEYDSAKQLFISRALLDQVLSLDSGMKSSKKLNDFLASTSTNLNNTALSKNLELIFSFDSFRSYEIKYSGSKKLIDLDGRKE
ncbi:MAG: hypothetical protein J5793_05250 [Clostridia bacterium]|nr:hypothetical protein [Clostridia bacterium]